MTHSACFFAPDSSLSAVPFSHSSPAPHLLPNSRCPDPYVHPHTSSSHSASRPLAWKTRSLLPGFPCSYLILGCPRCWGPLGGSSGPPPPRSGLGGPAPPSGAVGFSNTDTAPSAGPAPLPVEVPLRPALHFDSPKLASAGVQTAVRVPSTGPSTFLGVFGPPALQSKSRSASSLPVQNHLEVEPHPSSLTAWPILCQASPLSFPLAFLPNSPSINVGLWLQSPRLYSP